MFDTDELAGLVRTAEELTGVERGTSPESDIALKLLADHARTMSFLVADGVVPSNEDRGFVLRRIIRRAIRFAYLLDVERSITPALAERTIELMGEAYPVLRDQADLITGTLDREETQFRRTLRSGLTILDGALAELPDGGQLPGSVAFQLHDTYGFPLEVTAEIVEDRGHTLDRPGFDAAMADQRDRARASGKKGALAAGDETDAFAAILGEHGTTDFVGRESFDVDARIVGVVPAADGTTSVFLDRTPFYAESGGQIGDTGTLRGDGFVGEVRDTLYAVPELVRHVVAVTDGEPVVGATVQAAIDVERRDAIRRNHTATHLYHWALREVLGPHVKQQGSLVAPDRLRFDFSHFEAVAPTRSVRIEDLVNADVLANDPVRHFETTKDEAGELGAIAFFGEKYGDVVKVLEAGPHSTELCGGTHVSRTGDIGLFKIVSESSIGSNLRRIEAITGFGPIDRIRREEAELADAAVPGRGARGRAARRHRQAPHRAEGPARRGQGPQGQARHRRRRRPRRRRDRRGRRRPGRRPGPRRPAQSAASPCAIATASEASCSSARPRAAASRSSPPSGPTAASTPAALIAGAARTVKGAAASTPRSRSRAARTLRASTTRLDQARSAAGIA